MRLWLVTFDKEPEEYKGTEILDFDFAGIDWLVFRAISKVDAQRQAELFHRKKHPIQSELHQNYATLRILAAESQERARTYFEQLYPAPTQAHPRRFEPPQTVALKLEAIGYETGNWIRAVSLLFDGEDYKPRRPWVAKIIGEDPKYKYKRSFIRHRVSFEEASKSGNRGVYFFYDLSPGHIYEVHQLVSNKNSCRYFCRVEDSELIDLTEEEVKTWLRKSDSV